ncbi:MAG: NADH-quinone oxidoreductase subunit N [Chitinophagales bacterium]|nr:NADH-quinone oxidoreductase subunit N [Chitinophagales bacterium]
MGTIIITTILGLLVMVLDMLKMRKVIPLFSSIVLLGTSIFNVYSYWNIDTTFYHGMIAIDRFSVVFSSLLLVISALLILLSGKFFEREADKISDYVALMVFTLVGGLLMVSYGNMATLFVGVEILSMSLYVLAASNRKSLASNEAGLKYFLMGAFMTGFLLFGITLLYGVTGSFDIYEIQATLILKELDTFLVIGLLFLSIALLFKASIAPFHFWAPDVYTGAPSLVTAFMITVVKVAAFGALYKLFAIVFLIKIHYLEPVLVFFIILTLLISNFSGLLQTSLKRILAFSGISHAAFLLLAIVSSNFDSPSTLFYYSAGYVFANVAAFSVIIYVSHVKGSDHVDAFRGLLYVRPGMAIAMIIAILSMAGIPPLAGFIGKYLVLLDTVQAQYTYLAIIAILMSVIAIYYYFKVIISMTKKVEGDSGFTCPPVIYTIVAWVSVIVVIVLGVAPKYFLGLF